MSRRARSSHSLNRETVRLIDDGRLGEIDGGQTQTAGTCPVTACICVTGIICQDLSNLACNVAIGPTPNTHCV
jgi:hypothetical protein